MKELDLKYDFKRVEKGKYEKWVKEGYFTAGDTSKKPYSIVLPPPNVTGELHLGHVFDSTLPDIIIRRKRMQGYDCLWLPGMDHAGIATQAKVEAMLREKGISKYDLGREKFLEECWKWKELYSGKISHSWSMLGLSLDYTRERFTLDEGLNHAVNYVFTKMYQEGLIYQGERIINWDIASKTALSNIEVIYEEEEASLYYYEYRLVDGSGSLVIATTRPETMFADQALMINPKDKRYLKYVGKEVYIPLTNIKIPIITDDYVDIKFGTGVVKVTPAHDPNDFEVGRRHNLAQPLCMNEDGTMNALAGKYDGMERFACRKQVLEDLKKEGYFRKIEKITHAIGHSERTGVIVEPRLSKQWFVKMDKLASDVLEMQNNPDEKVNFHPKRFERTFKQWLENIQDWCISRQLWWGHQIPVWYKGEEIYVGTEAPKGKGWTRDPDVLDTWFSSALWPFSTMGWPEITPDLKRYFPTDVLVTGYDIIFFWVARMVFQSKHFLNTRPFKGVLIHGIVRDEIGRKMSKSLGNGIVPEEMIDKYGVDSLRYFITTTVSLGEDLRFSQEKVEAAWNYINKIWNIARYIKIQFDNASYNGEEIDKKHLSLLDKWFITRLHKVIREVDPHFEKYNFGEAARAIYRFIWDDFASWYLEMTKVVFTESTSKEKRINTCAVLNYGLKTILKLLHPFMPFFTEEIYQKYYSQSIVISNWPEVDKNLRFNIGDKMNIIFDIITNVRNIRAEYKIVNSKKIDLEFETKDQSIKKTIEENLEYLKRFCNYDNYQFLDKIDLIDKAVRVLKGLTMALPLKDLINFEEEKEKLNLEKTKLESEISRCEKMLENPNFVSKAPASKVEEERNKLESYRKQLGDVLDLIKSFS